MANSGTNKSRPFPLPDLAIDQILESLPTKAAVRMSCISKQRQGLWSLSPVIDFVERDIDMGDVVDANCGGGLDDQQHRKFTNILKRYLEYRENKQLKRNHDALRKFRLRMASYVPGPGGEDAAIVEKWLTFCFERKVEKLDISLRTSKSIIWDEEDEKVGFYHCLSLPTFVNATSLTSLKLEHVRMELHRDHLRGRTKHFLCLKTMSLKDVHFSLHSLFFLIDYCPSIAYLSLTSCSFEKSQEKPVCVMSSSIKTLQFKHCNVGELQICHVTNLESFTFFSTESVPIHGISLEDVVKLKHVDIRSHQLKSVSFFGECPKNIEAVLDTPNLDVFCTHGHVESKFHVKASKEIRSVEIVLWELWGGAIPKTTLDDHREHFKAVTNFLKQFSCARSLVLTIRNYEAIIFPENLRKAFSSPPIFPRLEGLRLEVCAPTAEMRHSHDHLSIVKKHPHYCPRHVTEYSDDLAKLTDVNPDLPDSLIWLAPSLRKITTCVYRNAVTIWSPIV